MRRLTTFTLYSAAALLLLSLSPSPRVSAQVSTDARVAVSGAIAADDTDIALKIRYIGDPDAPTENSGLVAVAVTTSDLTFTQGVLSSEAATDEFECPVSGSLGGVIDVSDAACNTVDEVLDVINASTSWRAVAVDALGSDSVSARLLTISATQAAVIDGLSINWDTSTAFDVSVLLNEPLWRTMRAYIADPQGRNLIRDPFSGQVTCFHLGNATSTYGSGSSDLRLYSVSRRYAGTARAHSDTVTTLYSEAGGATTANKIFDDAVQVGICSLPGEGLLVRLDNSAAAASAVLYGFGYKYRSP